MSDEYKLTSEEFLKEYSNIKTEGKIGDSKEAVKWLQKAFTNEKNKYVVALTYSSGNFNQEISIDELEESELEMILDDFDYVSELIFATSSVLTTCYALYHNPELFNVYEGEIMGEKVYYVESKAEGSSVDVSGLYS